MIKIPKKLKNRQFFNRINTKYSVKAKDEITEIALYDEIGFFGISADDFRRTLDEVDTPRISLRINSPGGDVFDGIAIFNDIEQHDAAVDVSITGLAASAASLIAMAGDSIEIADNAWMMIHNAWGLVIGDKNDMREVAELLDDIDGSLASTYAKRADADEKEIAKMMNDETWMVGKDAVDAGFADTVSGEESANALYDLSVFNNVPAMLKRKVENGLRDAGYSRAQAKAAINDGFQSLNQREAGQRDAEISAVEALTETINKLRA